jgi:hypothetical protein
LSPDMGDYSPFERIMAGIDEYIEEAKQAKR